MNCPTPETLSSYLEGELDRVRTSAIRAHLACCPRCQRELEAIETVASGLRDLPQVQFTAVDTDRLLALGAAVTVKPRGAWRYRSVVAVAAAAVLAFGVGFIGTNVYHRSGVGPEPAAYSLQAFVSDHQGYETILAADGDLNVQVLLTE